MDAQTPQAAGQTTTRLDIADGIAVVTMYNSPGNALARSLRADLMARIAALAADDAIRGIVLTGGPRVFSTGLDIREIEQGPEAAPRLADLCVQIAACKTPVVAAIQGLVLGSGLELALACHARIAAPTARAGFPELLFGLIPGAGGTQRLPRLIGAARALALLISPRQHVATAPELAGVFDAIAPDPVESAVAQLRAGTAGWPPRDRHAGLDDPSGNSAAIRAARRSLDAMPETAQDSGPDIGSETETDSGTEFGPDFGPDFGPRTAPGITKTGLPVARIIDCVEAALLLPLEQGLAFERAAYEDCRDADTTRGLLHAYFAERRGKKMPELVDQDQIAPDVVGVVGVGAAAMGIVAALLAAGLRVVQFDRATAALTDAGARLNAMLDPADTAIRQRFGQTTDIADLALVDLVIEAGAETPLKKAEVFAALGQATRPGTVLATNSLIQAIAPLAQAAGRPQDVLALHLHGPARTHTLAEIIIGPDTAGAALARAVALTQKLGKHVVRSAGGAGSIGERMQAALRDALTGMVNIGVPPVTIDRALLRYGFVHAPLAAMDRVGIDVVAGRGALLARDCGRLAEAHLALLQIMLVFDRRGRGAGVGFYRWEGDVARHDPELLDILPDGARNDPGLSASEIMARAIAALANEGARLLRENIALRPSDIDAVMVLGYGFPRIQGGPMKAADMAGIFDMGLMLRRMAEADPVLYAPDPGFAELARYGENFDVLNRIGRARRRIPG